MFFVGPASLERPPARRTPFLGTASTTGDGPRDHLGLTELLSDAPITGVRLTQRIAGRVGDNQLGALTVAIDDRVLAEGAPKIHRFFAIDVVYKPGRLSPRDFGFILVADALFDAIASQNQKFSHHLMSLLVDSSWQQHGSRIVGSKDSEGLLEQRWKRRVVLCHLSIERDANGPLW